MKRMRAAREAGNLSEWRKGMREGANMRNGHRLKQSKSVREGANERKIHAQRALCEAADNHCFMSFFCATHQFLLSWLEMTLLEVGTPTSHKNEFITGFYLPHQQPQWLVGKAFQQPSWAGLREERNFLTFTSAGGKAQLDCPLSAAVWTTKHVRNVEITVVCSFCEMVEVQWVNVMCCDLLEAETLLCLCRGPE